MKKSRVSLSHILGELLLTIGVILLLFTFYEAYWTNLESNRLQDRAKDNLEQEWHNPRAKLHPELGEAFARLYIPTFGSDFNFAIVEGTEEDDLLRGQGVMSIRSSRARSETSRSQVTAWARARPLTI